jgi:predicted MFS family arabinose efflux permease
VGLALIMFGTIHTYMPFLVMDKLGGGGHLPGIYFSLYSSALAFGSISLGRIVTRFSSLRAALGANLLMVLAMLGFLTASGAGHLVPALLGYGFGSGLLMALTMAHIARNTTQDTRGTVLSLSSTVFRAAQTVSPPLCGLLFSLGGFSLLYGAATLAAMALLVVTRAAFRPNPFGVTDRQ